MMSDNPCAQREYIVYFQIGNKKMKRVLYASSDAEARDLFLRQIHIDSVRRKEGAFNNCMDMLQSIEDMVKPKNQ